MSEPATKVEVLGPYWVCSDCLMFIANGDLPDCADDETAKAVVAGVESEPGHWVAGGECEEHQDHNHCAESGCDSRDFSWSDCECCGSSLGGSRHKASVIVSG